MSEWLVGSRWSNGLAAAASLAAVAAVNSAALADVPAPGREPVQTVIVTAKKRTFDPVEDAATTVRVQAAIHNDPYFLDDHMTVVTIDGVVYLEGYVDDDWDLTRVLRTARRLAGGRRVVNRLEFSRGGSD